MVTAYDKNNSLYKWASMSMLFCVGQIMLFCVLLMLSGCAAIETTSSTTENESSSSSSPSKGSFTGTFVLNDGGTITNPTARIYHTRSSSSVDSSLSLGSGNTFTISNLTPGNYAISFVVTNNATTKYFYATENITITAGDNKSLGTLALLRIGTLKVKLSYDSAFIGDQTFYTTKSGKNSNYLKYLKRTLTYASDHTTSLPRIDYTCELPVGTHTITIETDKNSTVKAYTDITVTNAVISAGNTTDVGTKTATKI